MIALALTHFNNANHHFKMYVNVIGKKWRYCIISLIPFFFFFCCTVKHPLVYFAFTELSLAFVAGFVDGLGISIAICRLS